MGERGGEHTDRVKTEALRSLKHRFLFDSL